MLQACYNFFHGKKGSFAETQGNIQKGGGGFPIKKLFTEKS